MSSLGQKLMGPGLQGAVVLKRTCLWSCLLIKSEGLGMRLRMGDGHMGLCRYGMGRKRRASGIESRLMICVWFQGRSWLGPFVCDVGGGQGGVRTFGRCLSEGDSRRNLPPVGLLTRVS